VTEARVSVWKSEGFWLGFDTDFPDHWTQGETFPDLLEMLESLRTDLETDPRLHERTRS
jgi:predicted RNase H-like HicB family nuclease